MPSDILAQFVRSAAAATHEDELDIAVQDFMAKLGFTGAAYIQLSGLGLPLQERKSFGDRLESWFQVYRQHEYVKTDPAVQLVYRSNLPFTALEVERWFPEFEEFYAHRRQLWVADAAFCPVLSSSGDVGVLVLESDAPLELARETRLTLSAGAQVAVVTYKSISGVDSGDSLQIRPLSRREMECVNWVSRGKSMEDIAMILKISPATVRQYLASGAEKLNASNRSEFVLFASSLGLLTPNR